MMTTAKTEKDPNGIAAHQPGAKLDAGKNKLGLVLLDFAHALEAVGQVGTYGANKYSAHGWLSVPDGVQRYTDAKFRHALKEMIEGPVDLETGMLHAAHEAWNALARLELMVRNQKIVERQAADKAAMFEAVGKLTVQTHGDAQWDTSEFYADGRTGPFKPWDMSSVRKSGQQA